MTVGELVKALQAMPQDARLSFYDEEGVIRCVTGRGRVAEGRRGDLGREAMTDQPKIDFILPGPEVNAETEVISVNGVRFVNADKHEAAVEVAEKRGERRGRTEINEPAGLVEGDE